MTASASYIAKRGQLEAYFDRTAADAWARLTSDAPVSGIRATVRAGRDAMRDTILNALPTDLSGARLLDAGCGPGQLALEAARRGADVVAVDLSSTLLDLARERVASENLSGSVDFRVGDMFDEGLGSFDYVVAMDSLIHYALRDMVDTLAQFANRTDRKVIATFAPKTPLLTVMHAVGGLFPKGDRAPAIQPATERLLRARLEERLSPRGWRVDASNRVGSGFYISQTMELAKEPKRS
ncbi:MAG: magnesium protoporphyrin IX methyltransferase [Pseudomonadota bacterium]